MHNLYLYINSRTRHDLPFQARVYFMYLPQTATLLPQLSLIPTTTPPKMPPSETTNLLPPTGGVGGRSRPIKFAPLKSSRHLLLGSWINLLLVAVPLSFIGTSFRGVRGVVTVNKTDNQPRHCTGVLSLDLASHSSPLSPLQR